VTLHDMLFVNVEFPIEGNQTSGVASLSAPLNYPDTIDCIPYSINLMINGVEVKYRLHAVICERQLHYFVDVDIGQGNWYRLDCNFKDPTKV